MITWFLFVLLFGTPLLAGAVPRETRQPKCKNPKGKLWSTLLDKDCGQSVCKKKGNKGVWEQCPRPATQDKLEEMERTILSATQDNLQEMERTMLSALAKLEEKIEEQFGYQTPTFGFGTTTPVKGEELPVVFRKADQFAISQNNPIGVLPYLGKAFIISFQLVIHTLGTKSGDYNNILHFSTGGDKEIYGDRTPAIWIFEGRTFQLASAINGNANFHPDLINFDFKTETWYNFEFSQILNDNAEYVFSFKVNGIVLYTTTNSQPGHFQDVIMYFSDPWYGNLDGSVKNLIVKTAVAGSKLYYEENGAKYYGIPVAKGTTLREGVVADTCDAVGMRAVCNGDSSCRHYSSRCQVVDFESSCGLPMRGLAKKLCGGETYPRNCPEMNGLFNYMNNWSGGECGVVNGTWCAQGNNFTPENPPVYYAYCVQGYIERLDKMSEKQKNEMIKEAAENVPLATDRQEDGEDQSNSSFAGDYVAAEMNEA